MNNDKNFSLDEDTLEDFKIIEFVRNNLPTDLKEKFSDDQFFYFLDLLSEYLEESGVLDAADDEEVEVPLEGLVNFIVQESKKDEVGEFEHDEILLVVQAILDYDN